MEIMIDNYDFWNFTPQKYYSFTSSYKGDKKAKAKELCLSGSYVGSRKMDGSWNAIIKDMDGNFHMRSRTESVNGGYVDKVEWIPQITECLAAVPNGTVLVGEIYFPDNEGSRKITSVLNCLKDKCLDRQKKNGYLHFYIFDIIAYNGNSMIDMSIRNRINYLNLEIFKNLPYVETAKYLRGQELWNMYGEVIATGGEGIVITREDCKYLCGKRTAWMTLKMKKELEDTIDAFLDGDFQYATRSYGGKEIETWPYWENIKTGEKFNTCKIVDYTNGIPVEPISKAYYNGWATRVSFSVMKDGKPVHIGWISGITDELKEGIVKNPDLWRGKVAELTCMEVEFVNGKYSLRHGKIKSWRPDKNSNDCSFAQLKDAK